MKERWPVVGLLVLLILLLLGSGLAPAQAARPAPGGAAGPPTIAAGEGVAVSNPRSGSTAAGTGAALPFVPAGGDPVQLPSSPGQSSVGTTINFAEGAHMEPASQAADALLVPAPGSNFYAQTDSGRDTPATHGAVGPNHLMSVHNGFISVQLKTGGAPVYSRTDANFWGTSPTPTGLFDPKVLYIPDPTPANARWVMVELSDARSATSWIWIAVSQSSDPTGNWTQYHVAADQAHVAWADYPGIGFNKNWVVVTVNMLANTDDAFRNTSILAINYPLLLSSPLQLPSAYFTSTSPSIAPAATYDPLEPNLFMVTSYTSGGYGYYTVTAVSGTPSAPSYPNFIAQNRFNPIFPYGWSRPGGNILPQPPPTSGDLLRIASFDDRVTNVVFRNNGVYFAQTVGLPGSGMSHTDVQWTQLDRYGNFQQGGRIAGDTWVTGDPWYAYPSIAVNACNSIMVGYSVFKSSAFASAGYSYRAWGDQPNIMRTPVEIKAGLGYFNRERNQYNAWGPYSATVIDPSNSDMWTIQEYAELSAPPPPRDGRWGTWWGHLTDIACTPPPPSTGTPVPVTPNTPTNTPTTRTPTPSPSITSTPAPTNTPACGTGLDVAFILDNTSSMDGALDSIKIQVESIFGDIERESAHDYRLALVTFKDNITIRANFAPNNRDAVRDLLPFVIAGGGDNIPEASDEALNTVIHRLPAGTRPQNIDFTEAYRSTAGRIAILVTDAVPGGFDNMFNTTDEDNAHAHAIFAGLNGIHIVSIFVPTGSNQAEPIMQYYAEHSDGIYVRANDLGSNVAAAIRLAIGSCGQNTPTVTATVSSTPTNAASRTPTATQTPTRSNTPTSTPTRTPTTAASSTPTTAASNTPTATATHTPTATITHTPTRTNTATPTPTSTPTRRATECAYGTPTRIPTPIFTPAPGCLARPVTGRLTAHITDHTNTTEAVFTNDSTCSYPIGLATYKRFNNNIDTQELFDYRLAVIPPHGTITLQVNNPPCLLQGDAFYGDILYSFAGGARYGKRRLDDTDGERTEPCIRCYP